MANSSSRTLILQEAARRGWQTETIGANAYFLKVTHPDGRWEMFRGPQPKRNSAIGNAVSRSKLLTLDFIKTYGYRVPEYALVTTEQEALDFLKQYGKVVIKPVDGAQSEGVTVNIEHADKIAKALAHALQHSSSGKAIMQQHVEGKLYRLLVLDGKMVAATWRPGSTVVGDGVHTVQELIEDLNLDPRRGDRADLALKAIDIDSSAAYLGDEVFKSVLEPGKEINVTAVDTIAGGGAVAVTDQVHPDWQRFAGHMAQELGLFICGFDLISEDISQPMQNNFVPVLEINATPGLRMHETPSEGEPVHVAPLLFDALFPDN
jgi:cyanophycin synthetase